MMMMSNEAYATRVALLDRMAPGCKNLIRLLKDFDYTLRSVIVFRRRCTKDSPFTITLYTTSPSNCGYVCFV